MQPKTADKARVNDEQLRLPQQRAESFGRDGIVGIALDETVHAQPVAGIEHDAQDDDGG